MATPQLRPEQIEWLSVAVADYIRAQQTHYASHAHPLTGVQRSAMNDFFNAAVLNTRLVTLENERVSNPNFYPALEKLGFHNLPDQSSMAAITFADIVVSHVRFDNGLLFHELVHAEQYCQLGIDQFSQLYVIGFLEGSDYEHIPLEMHAYELGARYEANPQRPFSVEEQVSDYIRRQLY